MRSRHRNLNALRTRKPIASNEGGGGEARPRKLHDPWDKRGRRYAARANARRDRRNGRLGESETAASHRTIWPGCALHARPGGPHAIHGNKTEASDAAPPGSHASRGGIYEGPN